MTTFHAGKVCRERLCFTNALWVLDMLLYDVLIFLLLKGIKTFKYSEAEVLTFPEKEYTTAYSYGHHIF